MGMLALGSHRRTEARSWPLPTPRKGPEMPHEGKADRSQTTYSPGLARPAVHPSSQAGPGSVKGSG